MGIQVAAVITAAGSSARMGGIKKEFCLLPAGSSISENEKDEHLTVLGSAVLSFAVCPRIDLIVIVIPRGTEETARDALPSDLRKIISSGQASGGPVPGRPFPCRPGIIFTEGGSSRQSSIYNGLRLLENFHPSWVLIHDGARPWLKTGLIENLIDAVFLHNAVIPFMSLAETPKEVDFSGADGSGFITRHLKRRFTGVAQTPQAFAYPGILEAHKKAAENESTEYTDDAEIWGEFNGTVAFIPGDPENRKITFPGDLLSTAHRMQ